MSDNEKKAEGLNIDKKTLFGIAALLFGILIIVGALTQFLPRGEFKIDENGSVIAGHTPKTRNISCLYGRLRRRPFSLLQATRRPSDWQLLQSLCLWAVRF